MSIVSGTPWTPVVRVVAGWLCVAAAHAGEAPPRTSGKFEGAVGLVLQYKPAFSGSSDFKWKPALAGFVRYGRFTITGAGGFTTRRQDEVERGLDAELLRREGWRVNLSLRFDPGRRESASAQLAGMGDIRSTVRARLGLRWDIAPRWQASASTSFDALNRVGGYVVSTGLTYTQPIDPRQRIAYGVSIGGAGDRYLQAWYGVTSTQSAASGHPVYAPREGLTETGVGATWRIEIDRQWAAFAGASVSRLLGGAAASPLTRQRTGWAWSSGIARRF
ncbi:MAG TPA: MipA/OmpV family protein [Burkholderiaceae bacterium]|nr:MipA/OmpV family protein [Burkholderiaceae bacterium]